MTPFCFVLFFFSGFLFVLVSSFVGFFFLHCCMGSVRTCNLELDDSDNLKNAQYPNYVDKFFSSLSAGLLMSFGVTGSTSMQSKVYWLHCSEARLKV